MVRFNVTSANRVLHHCYQGRATNNILGHCDLFVLVPLFTITRLINSMSAMYCKSKYYRAWMPNINWRQFYRNRKYSGVPTSSENPALKPFKEIPGLSSFPIFGPIPHFLPIIGVIGPTLNFNKMTDTLYKKFGSIVKMDGVFSRGSAVVLFEPELYEQVYRSEDVLPLRPGFAALEYYKDYRKDIFDGVHGLTIAQGAQWRDFRTKVNPALLKPKLVKLYSSALDEIAREMVARLTKLDSTYLEHSFDLEMKKFALESVALVGLGARLGCLGDNLGEHHPARILMRTANDILDLSFKLELFPSPWRHIPTPTFKKLMKTFDMQWNTSSKYIEEARTKINERGHDIPDEDKSIIEKLLAIDERVAIMMANEMLMAGIDTVAFTMTAMLYELATNQKVQDKLREHIRSGDASNRYLKACLKETLRLRPVVSANLRRTSKDHEVAGYHVPKGVDVIAPNQYLSRMEKYYPRPTEFVPERWLVQKNDPLYYGNAHPMVTLPFGFGIRSCIGRRIAELEIEIFVQRLIGEYRVSWQGPPIKTRSMVVNAFKKPFNFKIENVL